MKCRWISILLTLLFLLILPTTVFASETLPMIVDNADLLTDSEEAALEETAQALRGTYEMDIVILTIPSLEGARPQDYAEDYYYNSNYGYGDDFSCVLFLLAMEERDWFISTSGNAVFALTDYSIQQLGESVVPHLSSGAYCAAFSAYLEELPVYLNAYQQGAPIDGYADYSGDDYHGDQEEVVYYEEDGSPSILLSLIIGVITAGVTVIIMRASMNTKRHQRSAAVYMQENSFHLRQQQDLFLYSNVTKTRRQENNSSGSSGGSSVHRGSGGRRHGGGGGKF